VVITPPTIDYIIITDAPDGNELTTVYIYTGGQVIAYASGYNNTGPTYVGLVEVNWTDFPDLGTFDNDTGTNTVFTAGQETGLTTITGQNVTLAVNDTFDVDIGEELTAHASSYYNNGPTYVGPVEVDWTDFLDLGTLDSDTGINMVFTTGLVGGSTTITGQYDTLAVSDTFDVDITNPTVDYVQIRDTVGGSGSLVTSLTLDLGQSSTLWASEMKIPNHLLMPPSPSSSVQSQLVSRQAPTEKLPSIPFQRIG
jgi:hypothetical protein